MAVRERHRGYGGVGGTEGLREVHGGREVAVLLVLRVLVGLLVVGVLRGRWSGGIWCRRGVLGVI